MTVAFSLPFVFFQMRIPASFNFRTQLTFGPVPLSISFFSPFPFGQIVIENCAYYTTFVKETL